MNPDLSAVPPIIVNDEAVIFVRIFGQVLRLAWPRDQTNAAHVAVGALMALSEIADTARGTWLPDPGAPQ